MEFDKPSTKYLFIGLMVTFALVLGTFIYKMVDYDRRSEARDKAEQQACKDLKVKWLEPVKIKDSTFYEGVVFFVARKGTHIVELQFPWKSHENITVRCIDVEPTENPYE